MEASSDVKPADLIGQLLNHAGIKRVICVDDEYASSSSPTVEMIIALCGSCSLEDARTAVAELGVTVDDPDVMASDLKRVWTTAGFDDDQKKKLYRKLKDLSLDGDKTDTRAASALSQVMVGQALIEMSFREWSEKKDSVLASKRRGGTLLLFDLDMSDDGGNSDSGVELIREVLAKTRNRFTCGLLSHTITSNGEHKAWKDLSERHSLDGDRFIPISKARLQKEKDFVGFADGIRRIVLNPQLKQLKKTVSKVMEDAQKKALEAVEKIDVFDLEHIVFRSSMEEGVWEPDTLLRLFGLYHKLNARKAYLSDPDLHALASRVRVLSTMAPNRLAGPNRIAWEIQQLELYEDPDLVNRSHLPIELGDIFEKSNGKRFILLAQPCDLMVRNNGSRHHAVNEGVLAEIVKDPSETCGDMLVRLLFYESPEHKWFVHLRRTYAVALSVLDLCSFQADGTARIEVTAKCSECVIPTWQKHYTKLSQYFGKLISKYETLKAQGVSKQEIEKAILRSSADGLFKGNVDAANKTISYDCRRIGRLCRSHSEALLRKSVV